MSSASLFIVNIFEYSSSIIPMMMMTFNTIKLCLVKLFARKNKRDNMKYTFITPNHESLWRPPHFYFVQLFVDLFLFCLHSVSTNRTMIHLLQFNGHFLSVDYLPQPNKFDDIQKKLLRKEM